MIFIAGLLTIALVVNCALLIFLVLVQLPKKDAGAGLAFGGGAADALFGAGSGNVLTKVTKYATVIFFIIALILGYVEEQMHRSTGSEFTKAVEQKQTQGLGMPPSSAPPPATAPSTAPAAAPQTNGLLTLPLPTGTNAPAK